MLDKHAAYCYDFPRPALTADVVALRTVGELTHRRQEILLVRRGHQPFVGKWALPGGFVDHGESPEVAARRELHEETGLSVSTLTQVGAFGEPGRDPRGWTVSVVYVVDVGNAGDDATAGDDAAMVKWWPVEGLPPLAFDHGEIVAKALNTAQKQ